MELRVTDLAVARGGIAVLAGLDFCLGPGAALILRGPNGAGKTSLLRTLAGLQPALHGQIIAPPEGLTYAAHADGLKSTLTVTENLSFWAEIHGQGRTETDHAIAAMNLTALRHRPAAQLSAGQKRRLGLARLLVTGRPVWLLDEPTVSLDQASVMLFAGVLRQHMGQGGSVLIATHIDLALPEAAELDLTPYRARHGQDKGPSTARDDAFAGGDAGDFA